MSQKKSETQDATLVLDYSPAYEQAYPELSAAKLRPIKRGGPRDNDPIARLRGGGASGNPELTALWQIDQREAARRVRETMNGRTVPEAARELRIGLRTLRRWLATKAELKEKLT